MSAVLTAHGKHRADPLEARPRRPWWAPWRKDPLPRRVRGEHPYSPLAPAAGREAGAGAEFAASVPLAAAVLGRGPRQDPVLLGRVRDGVAAIGTDGEPAGTAVPPPVTVPDLPVAAEPEPVMGAGPEHPGGWLNIRCDGDVIGRTWLPSMPAFAGTFTGEDGTPYAGLWLGEDDPLGGLTIDTADTAWLDALIIAAIACKDMITAGRTPAAAGAAQEGLTGVRAGGAR